MTKLPYLPDSMRRIRHCLVATIIAAAPIPVSAQVSVDLNALNRLGAGTLPAPPPSAPRAVRYHHDRMRHLARAGRAHAHPEETAIGGTQGGPAPAGPETIEHPTNLGPSFASLPALPGAPPPAPLPLQPAQALPAQAQAQHQTQAAKPTAAPKPPPAATAPPRLAEVTPAPAAAQPPETPAKPAPAKSVPDALPAGADLLTLPFFVQETDLPATETAMLRNFAERAGAGAQYVIRAYASAPAGDDDPSTPRRIALSRAQSVAAALADAGVGADRIRLLALGQGGGAPADRVEVIAMPPSSGHTQSASSP